MDETLIISELEAGMRLDKWLASHYQDYSRQYFQYLIEKKLVLVNGLIAKKAYRLEIGDEIEIEFALTPEITLEPENIPLDILYEDDALLAINKPVDMVVHPAAGNWSGTFVHALLYHCNHLPKGETLRPGIVHRLDKQTTGVLLAAKTERAQSKLVESFAARRIEKTYLAVCVGNPKERVIEGNIGRHPVHRKKMAVIKEGGKPARTLCKILRFSSPLSLVELGAETGRTHQLRVHLQSIGTPILGDPVYGTPSLNKKYGVERQLLHAHRLVFDHPITGAHLVIEAPLPEDMTSIIEKFLKP